MCVGIPMKVLAVGEYDALCQTYPARAQEPQQSIDTQLIDTPVVGDWVLVFRNAAREILTAERAQQVGDALTALAQIDSGDLGGVDQLFADLIDHEPQLPPHLQDQVQKEADPMSDNKELS